jgi:hypothetical protein
MSQTGIVVVVKWASEFSHLTNIQLSAMARADAIKPMAKKMNPKVHFFNQKRRK